MTASLNIGKLAVIGAGQMGAGIAQISAAAAKIPTVYLFDPSKAQLDKQLSLIDKNLSKSITKGAITEDEKAAIMKRICPTSTLEAVAEAKFIIEAIPENEQMKLDLFRNISKIVASSPESPILASNTSSISITKLASSYKDPSKFVGMHFMNPVPVMKLVELISGKQTSSETLQITKTLAGLMGKTTTVSQDVPGFIANRLLMPYLNEAIFALYEGVGTREDIDTTMLLGTNVPMGPLKLADFIGLDTCLAITKVLHTEFGDSKYRPCPLLVQMVNAGYLGKKSGKGFYEYHN